MPRRQIRSPKSSARLDAVLREVDDLPDRLSSETLFGDSKPLEIEVGSGKGLFMATESAAHPEHNFLGG